MTDQPTSSAEQAPPGAPVSDPPVPDPPESDPPAVETLADLPPTVRTRVVALAAEALPLVAQLPAPLRKVASFAPPRRARLGAGQITAALADDDFRERVGVQAAAQHARLAAGLRGAAAGGADDAGPPAPEQAGRAEQADPADVAALGWLLRPEGWRRVVTEAVHRVRTRQQADTAARDRDEVAAMSARVGELEEAAAALREQHRGELARLRQENADLRRKLGQARSALRQAQAEAADAGLQRDSERERAAASAAAADAEARRLRGQLADAQAAVQASRRTVREGREDTTIRARLLLDTLLDAAQGLRRELALPTVEAEPADRLEGEIAEAGVRDSSAAGAWGPNSPQWLEQLLALPRARLIVDGYNVTKATWPESSLEVQRARLLAGLAPLVARCGASTTVVFDAASSTARPPVAPPRGVKVIFSPPGVIADDVIRDLVAAEPAGRPVVVVSDDAGLGADVSRSGARVLGAAALVGLIR